MNRPPRNLVSAASLLLAAVAVVLPGGCGSSSLPPPTTVRGTVQFQGRPLSGGLIVFAPDADRGATGRPVSAEIEADGSFQLRLEGSPNVPPGWYRVAVAEPPASTASRTAFPASLHRPDRSGLIREVQAGQDNIFEFLIETPARPADPIAAR